MKSLGRAVWGIQQGVCPWIPDSNLIFGSFRVATPTPEKENAKKIYGGIFPFEVYPSTSKFHVFTPKLLSSKMKWVSGPIKKPHFFVFLGLTHSPCLVRFISMANFVLARCMGLQSVAYSVDCAELTGQTHRAICWHVELKTKNKWTKKINYIGTK